MNKTVVTGVIVAIVFGSGGYYFGSRSVSQSSTQAQLAQNGTGFATRAGAASRAGFGGATFGTILSSGNGSITLQLMGGTSSNAESGTKIVLVNSSTQIEKMASGSLSDLTDGTTVSVNGTANSDGSITATNIQIRPVRLQGIQRPQP